MNSDVTIVYRKFLARTSDEMSGSDLIESVAPLCLTQKNRSKLATNPTIPAPHAKRFAKKHRSLQMPSELSNASFRSLTIRVTPDIFPSWKDDYRATFSPNIAFRSNTIPSGDARRILIPTTRHATHDLTSHIPAYSNRLADLQGDKLRRINISSVPEQSVFVQAFNQSLQDPLTESSLKPSTAKSYLGRLEIKSKALRPNISDPVKASWQVDAFRWPSITDRFLSEHSILVSNIGTTVLRQLDGLGNRLAIAGVGRKSGKSMLAVCLARWLAKRKSRILLVDADIDSCHLTLFAGVEQRISWLDIMLNDSPFNEALIESCSDNITLAALRKSTVSVPAKSAAKYLSQLTQAASNWFDFVIVDIGDANFLNQTVDTRSSFVDGAVLIHRDQDSMDDQIELARLRLINRGIKPIAIVRNFAK